MTLLPPKGAAYATLIANRTFVVLDIETTTRPGADGAGSATYPISIGAVVLFNGIRRETFHELTNPGVPVDKASSAHNGIRTADLAAAPDNAAVLAKLDVFLAAHPDAFIVCHNAYFDVVHLDTAYTRAGMTPFSRPVIDTEFLPIRLRIAGAVTRPKLTALATQYGVATSLPNIAADRQRLHKAVLDAQNTAEVLSWLLAEAAAKGIVDFDDFLAEAKVKSSNDIAAHAGRRRRTMRPPSIPTRHIRSAHGKRGLPIDATPDQVAVWVGQVTECIRLHCPHVREKTAVEAHRHATLLPALTPLLTGAGHPGDAGTTLVALQPMLTLLDRAGARAWYRRNHSAIKAAAPCTEARACPDCVAGRPCPKDVVYQLLTRRALDYGVTPAGEAVSLFSRRVKDDLWDVGNDRKMDTWPAQGMHDMAAHMMWMLLAEARRKHNTTRAMDIIAKAVARNLHEHDPGLALEVAQYWSQQPRKERAIARLVELMRTKATSDPGYLLLDVWFEGSYHQALLARTAAKARKAKVKAKGLRKVAPNERRPGDVQHTYRYQLHRQVEAA
jgi:DNA polymerase III epsilon subunit-like protein